MNQQQLADAFERAQREINTQQERSDQGGPGAGISAAREYDRNGLQGSSLDRAEPVKEPFNDAAIGKQQANDQPKPPSLEYRPPAPAPSPPGMGGVSHGHTVQNEGLMGALWEKDGKDGIVKDPENTVEMNDFQKEAQEVTGQESPERSPDDWPDPELWNRVNESIGPQTKADVDKRVQEIEQGQKNREAQNAVGEWANEIKAREAELGGPDQERDLE